MAAASRDSGSRRVAGWVVVALLLTTLSSSPVYAYIDPGTGSLIYQTLVAAVLGLGLAVRGVRDRVIRTVRRILGLHDDLDGRR